MPPCAFSVGDTRQGHASGLGAANVAGRNLPRPPPEPLFHLRRAPGQRQVVHEHDAVQVVVERPALGLVVLLPSRSHSSTKHGLWRSRVVEDVDEAHARVDVG